MGTLSMFFYAAFVLLLIAIVIWLLIPTEPKKIAAKTASKHEPKIDFDLPDPIDLSVTEEAAQQEPVIVRKSLYDPTIIALQIRALPGKQFMGYELLQTLLAANFKFGDLNIFHRYEDGVENGDPLFSLAAATANGSFEINNIGAFKCCGLVLFMKVLPNRKLISCFDLMCEAAHQLADELGGEIYNDTNQLLDADACARLREKVYTIETNSLYSADLLHNLDNSCIPVET